MNQGLISVALTLNWIGSWTSEVLTKPLHKWLENTFMQAIVWYYISDTNFRLAQPTLWRSELNVLLLVAGGGKYWLLACWFKDWHDVVKMYRAFITSDIFNIGILIPLMPQKVANTGSSPRYAYNNMYGDSWEMHRRRRYGDFRSQSFCIVTAAGDRNGAFMACEQCYRIYGHSLSTNLDGRIRDVLLKWMNMLDMHKDDH